MSKLRLLAAGAAMFVAACSDGGDVSQAERDVSEAPSVSPTAAPGVAFRYEYDFQLADESISAMQEAHASACERLGTARCRITGLRFSVTEDDAVSAMLEVKLAPEIARQFGKSATEQVTKADGQLLSTEFTGEDVMPATSAASRDQGDLESRIAALEAQLSTARSPEERAQLSAQINELRTRLADAKSKIAGASERLASTPMTFNYYGRGGITGFKRNPLRESGQLFVSSIVTMVTFILRVVAVLLPWALLIVLLVLLARSRVGRAVRTFVTPRPSEEPDA